MFGWNQDLTWKIAEIKPSEAQGFSEVTALFNTPQGQQVFRIFVTPDEKFAVTGDMVPFGADPFAPARANLKSASGPVHGPSRRPRNHRGVRRLRVPRLQSSPADSSPSSGRRTQMKLIFQNFPLESVHKWALLGAKYVDCVSRKATTRLQIHRDGLRIRARSPPTPRIKLKGYAKDAGANPDTGAACVAKPETETSAFANRSRWVKKWVSTARPRSSSTDAKSSALATTRPTRS